LIEAKSAQIRSVHLHLRSEDGVRGRADGGEWRRQPVRARQVHGARV